MLLHQRQYNESKEHGNGDQENENTHGCTLFSFRKLVLHSSAPPNPDE